MSFLFGRPVGPWRRPLQVLLLYASFLALLSSTTSGARLVVDSTIRHQAMEGFGASVHAFEDPGLFPDLPTGSTTPTITTKQQGEVLDLLYQSLNLRRVRPATPDSAGNADIEATNDNDSPDITDLSRFNFDGSRLDSHLTYYAGANRRGADAMLLSPNRREAWMGTSTSTDVEEYSEWLLAQARRATQSGTPLRYLSVTNGPTSNGNSMSAEFIRDVIKNVGPRLQNQGFDARFVIPADLQSSRAAFDSQTVLSDPEALSYVDALAIHLGSESPAKITQMEAIANQHHLPLWMTESSASDLNAVEATRSAIDWASRVNEVVSDFNVSAVDYKLGFAGAGNSDSTALVTLNESAGEYTGYTLNKAYFAIGQYSRFVAPGAQRIEVQSTDSEVRSTAFLSNANLVMVVTNNSDFNQDVTFDLRGVTADQFSRVRTSLTENWSVLPIVRAEESTFTITLPPNSIETLSASLAGIVPGDFDENGDVDAVDLTKWEGGFGLTTDAQHADGDANGDLAVDGSDLLLWQRDFSVPIEMTGDFDGVAGVGAADLAIWQAGYGMLGTASTLHGDANGDHDVDGSDFLLWQRSFSEAGGSSAAGIAVPEPASIVIGIWAFLTASVSNHKKGDGYA